MTQDLIGTKWDMEAMVKNMKALFDEETVEKRQEFEAFLKDFEDKRKESNSVMKMIYDSKTEEMERAIERRHHVNFALPTTIFCFLNTFMESSKFTTFLVSFTG